MPKTETIAYDSAAQFADADGQRALLQDAFDTGDTAYITHALAIVARARRMAESREVGEAADDARSKVSGGEADLGTLLEVVGALGMALRIAPKKRNEANASNS